ncbi:gamma-butyrobetaine hydroxylase [Cyathus striatus]|nr:gamma-butyrobetaine hydroxylase [Cyathus striatus]
MLSSLPALSNQTLFLILHHIPTGITLAALNNTTFPYIWLRDACQAPASVHPSTSQKLFRSSDIPFDISPQDITISNQGLNVVWNDGHLSFFDRSFLERHSSPETLRQFHKDISPQPWTRSSISSLPSLYLTYAELQTPQGLLKGIKQLCACGLLFVSGVPNEKTADKECELRNSRGHLARYVPQGSRNIAYTNLDLGLHMDLLYFQHPPRYQILHCLRNRVRGGTSIFVDALYASETLRKTDPEAFSVLTTTPVSFHYINDGHHLHYEHPTIELLPPGTYLPTSSTVGAPVSHINYSPPFQAPLPLSTSSSFYPSLRKFTELLNAPEHTYDYTLKEGDAVMFDNRRVLHARSAFDDIPGLEAAPGETNRWLKGCYLEADAIVDRGRVLQGKVGKI